MIRIAHLSDLHLLESSYARRSAGDFWRLRYLNTGRGIVDPRKRRARTLAALRLASRADHIVITGDLTEEGLPAQFELLAEVLYEAGIAGDRLTLVPGNHDYYGGGDAWRRALAGPLAAYAATSTPGAPVDFGEVRLLPVCTAVPQHFLRSSGLFSAADAARIARHAGSARTLLVAQHHPPLRIGGFVRHFIDGLVNAHSATALLAAHAHVHVLHGHLHRSSSKGVVRGRAAQVHCTGAVLQSPEHVRFYEAADGQVRSLDAAELRGALPSCPRAAALSQVAVARCT